MNTQEIKLTENGTLDYDYYIAAAHQARAEATVALLKSASKWFKGLFLGVAKPSKVRGVGMLQVKHCHS